MTTDRSSEVRSVMVECLDPAPGRRRERVERVTSRDVVIRICAHNYALPRSGAWIVTGPVMSRLSPRSPLVRKDERCPRCGQAGRTAFTEGDPPMPGNDAMKTDASEAESPKTADDERRVILTWIMAKQAMHPQSAEALSSLAADIMCGTHRAKFPILADLAKKVDRLMAELTETREMMDV
jgi:hypothetical protein